METEFKAGDRVQRTGNPHWHGNIIATNGGWAWIKDGGTTSPTASGHWEYPICGLTRIEPAAPQPKFRVGQRVRIIGGQAEPVEITEVVLPPQVHYRIRWPPVADHDDKEPFVPAWTYAEFRLEAVPNCPTCGGKMGTDG